MRKYCCMYVLIFGLLVASQSNIPYTIFYDRDLNPHTSSENIASFHHMYKYFDDKSISKYFKNYPKTKLFLVDYPLTWFLGTLQHEYYGHGARLSSFDQEYFSVSLPLAPPFSLELPHISYILNPDNNLTKQQSLAISSSGSQANTILANIIRKNFLLQANIDYRDAFLYLFANNELAGYSAFASSLSDIQKYKNKINDIYQKGHLSEQKINLYGAIAILADPINYQAFKSIGTYTKTGNTPHPLSMFRVNEHINYLPKLSYMLTPYGIEIILQNYLQNNDKLYVIDLGVSDNTFQDSWHINLQTYGWQYKALHFDYSFYLWNQPSIEYFVGDVPYKSLGFGKAFKIRTYYDLAFKQVYNPSLVLELSYKDKGFLQGEPLHKDIQIKAGISFNLL